MDKYFAKVKYTLMFTVIDEVKAAQIACLSHISLILIEITLSPESLTYMKKVFIKIAALLPLVTTAVTTARANVTDYNIIEQEIHQGYVYKKVWLKSNTPPSVKVIGSTYTGTGLAVAGTTLRTTTDINVRVGVERKRPFAIIGIPAYRKSADGQHVERLSDVSVDITEQATPAGTMAAKPTTATNSVLASGTWYKIGITNTGLYKIDATLLTAMGVSLSSIDPANIRIVGNGGNVLSENNALPRTNDLTENNIWVNDGGDNTFNTGDYVVFYGVGPTTIVKDSLNRKFTHINNLYSDTAYYFISFNSGAGARMQSQGTAPAANVTSSGFNYYSVSDIDNIQPSTYGKGWLAEKFSPDINVNTKNFSYNLGDNMANLTARISFACTQGYPGSTMSATLNGASCCSVTFNNITTPDGAVLLYLNPEKTAACNSNVANFSITFNASGGDASAKGYLNYIELNGRRSLNITGSQLTFRDWETVGAGNVAGYSLASANSFTRVWDVTDPQHPVQMAGSLSGSTYSFSQDASRLHEFVAMNSDALNTPVYIGTVDNQNLHASAPARMIIVTAPQLLSAAKDLANFHTTHDNMTCQVVTTTQVYNEFSSGAQDISAIRDFVRYKYEMAGTDTASMPRYLLLFGSASYDYKHRLPNNCNLVPTFESANDTNAIAAFMSDDFYGFLDDSENIEDESRINALDVGVGRISARDLATANDVVAKIIHYKSSETLGPWRIAGMFVGDNNDGAGFHCGDAELMARTVNNSTNNLYNEQKVYLDVIPITTTPAGDRCPNANVAISDQIYKGVFMLNYNGHGRHDLLAHERILTSDDYNTWGNINSLPFMITATCDFGQFDHPDYISAAEALLFDTKGGVIAMITTTQAVFASQNADMNREYLASQFTKNSENNWNTFGDAFMTGKNMTYLTSHDKFELINFRKWALIGDPALVPNFPEHKVYLDSVIDGVTLEQADSVKALGKYILKGSVRDANGNVLNNFTGTTSISFYDKARSVAFPPGLSLSSFKLQDNVIYKGKVSVTNGHFALTFITPKDINYFFGKGKISTYAENGSTDAAGMDTSVAVGGFSDNPVYNDNPPIVQPYINDSLFINGGITAANTSLFVVLHSETGINVSGYSIGHDLIGILDGQVESPYILNDYYETAPNTYQLGYVKFPVSGLTNGPHSIRVKAWDVNNNMGEGTVDFVVVDGQVVAIQGLGNYPNPFSGNTHFVFEHNHPEEAMDVTISIYNTGGALAKTIKQSFTPTGSRSADITWDGTTDGGAPLPAGVYVYRLTLSTEKGFKASAYQKLVIIR